MKNIKNKGLNVKDLLLSRLETYLMDKEQTIKLEPLEEERQEERTDYPQEFFRIVEFDIH